MIGSWYDVTWCIIFANVVERRSGSEIKESVEAEENDEHYEQEHNIVKTNIFWFIAYAPFKIKHCSKQFLFDVFSKQ